MLDMFSQLKGKTLTHVFPTDESWVNFEWSFVRPHQLGR